MSELRWKLGIAKCECLSDNEVMFTVTLENNGRWLGPYAHYFTDVSEAMTATELHVKQELMKREKAKA
jgi:hypothetical protein